MKRGKQINIHINFSNRWLYTFIIFGILIIAGIGVYAAQQAASGGTHNWAEVGIPSCSNGQVLKWSNGWACGTDIDTDTDTDTDTNTWPPKGKPVYIASNPNCLASYGGLLNPLIGGQWATCNTAVCKTVGSSVYRFGCDGSCTSTSYKECPNELLGYITAPY